nr:uncharacterized protein LOC113830007 [Penaeus vannamei]
MKYGEQRNQQKEDIESESVRVGAYAENIIPLYNDQEFKSHFRMHRPTFMDLCQILRPHLSNKILSEEKKILATLWLLGNQESFRGVGDRFNLSKSSLHKVFLKKTGFPGVVGAIDGTHTDSRDFHLLGDMAYPLSPFMIVPYKNTGHLTPETEIFKKIHSSTRVVIERDLVYGSYKTFLNPSQRLYMKVFPKWKPATGSTISKKEPQFKRCPHCDGEHGAESCTTCRTYHRYFPRPSRPRAHAHAYHTNNPQAALKVLRQPGRRDLRPRKRYLAEIDGALHGEALRHPRRARSLSPQRRPTSAPPDRLDLGHSRSRKDDDDDPSADEDEHESRSHSRSNSRSNSRSPSPPASHASAPATMTRRRQRSYRRPLTPSFRRRHDDSDDDLYDDLYIPRRYYHHHYPWEDCPLCYPDYPYLPRYPHLARYYHAHALRHSHR